MFRVLYLVLLGCGHVMSQTGPNFCTYAGEMYTCDYGSMVTASDRPIDFTGFSQAPQRLRVNVNGMFPFFGDTQTFSATFGSISTAAFDTNFPATLTIDCSSDGTLYFNTGAFNNMSYVQRLEIKNCKTVNIPSSLFEPLGDLDYFGIEGGYIDGVDPNAMYRLNVEELTGATHTFPRFLGKFEVRYSPFTGNAVPPGLLFNWKNLTSASLIGTGIATLTADTFRYNTKLKHVDLTDNTFTALPSGLFNNLDALSEVTAYTIDWACTCSDLWFVSYATTNNITLTGDFMCSSPNGTTVFKYYYDNCVASGVCGAAPGIVLMDHCFNAWAMTAIITGFIALVVLIVCLVLVCQARKKGAAAPARRAKAKGRWNKIMDSTMKNKLKNLTKKK